MPCKGSSNSLGVCSRIQEVSLDVANIRVCCWMSPAGLQAPPAESSSDHWMSRTSWYVTGCPQQVSRHLQQNPGGIIGCHEPRGMSLEVSSRSPGFASRIQEGPLHVANLMVCLWMSLACLPVSPAESRRYHWMSQTSWYVSGCLLQVSRCLQRIQEVSLDVANINICLAKAPASLQVSAGESNRYHWML